MTRETTDVSETAEPITLREVTRETLAAVLRLKVRPDQERFVASNAVSIAQAHFYPETAWFRAVYSGETPVGFLMLEVEPAEPRYYLWRFMIGAEHQGRGVGRRALEVLFDHVRSLPGGTVLYLSCVPGDGSPGPFYEKIGFAYTGEEHEGELVMRREL
jgi:diamine N-acetyltransferase